MRAVNANKKVEILRIATRTGLADLSVQKFEGRQSPWVAWNKRGDKRWRHCRLGKASHKVLHALRYRNG